MMGLSTTGNISFGMTLVAGKNRVPRPAAGNTALRTVFMSSLTRKYCPNHFFNAYHQTLLTTPMVRQIEGRRHFGVQHLAYFPAGLTPEPARFPIPPAVCAIRSAPR